MMNLWQLFVLVISLTAVSFGGGNTLLAGLERAMVPPGHITPMEFAAAVAYGQSTPGPLAAVTTAVGNYALGLPGAIASTLGLVVVSLGAVFLIGRLPAVWFAHPAVKRGLALTSTYAVAVVLFLGYRIFLAGSPDRWGAPALIVGLVVIGRHWKAPTALLIIGSVAIGMAVQGLSWAGW